MSEKEIKEVWNDVSSKKRREFWTDGEWIKIGRNVDDPNLCLTFRYDDDYYSKFRRGDHPLSVTIKDDRGSNNKYVVDKQGFGTFRFYKGKFMVLEVNDHELGTIRAVYKKARQFRQKEYNWEEYAHEYVTNLFPQTRLEIIHFGVENSERANGEVRVAHQYAEETDRVNEEFIQAVREAEHTNWNGVYFDEEILEGGFYYVFTVDAEAIRKEKEQ